jgi:hypothetical protein
MEVVCMKDKYEYHKQNEYPGERVAEKKRVAEREEEFEKKADARVAEKSRTEGLKADVRVAKKGRMNDELMDDEIKRSRARANKINKRRNTADTIGLIIIGGLVLLLLSGAVFGFMTIQKQSNEVDTLNSKLDKAQKDNEQLSIANNQICGAIDTIPPTILYLSPLTSVSPSNNEMNVPLHMPITVMFSEDMDPLTINKNTFTVEQRTTPIAGSDADQYRSLPIEGTITYSDRKATFTSKERFTPSQIYGNVFTVTITKGVKDIAGNALLNDYIWSFTTGTSAFNTGGTTSQTN